MTESMDKLNEKYQNPEPYRVVVSSIFLNLFTMQVCCVKDATDEEILKVCNTENRSGTSGGWQTVVRDGEGKPGQCEKYPDRYHILVQC